MSSFKEIAEYIRSNRVSTTEVADALGKRGVVPGPMPLTAGQFRVGKARCIFTSGESNYPVHEQILDMKKGDIPIIFTHECCSKAVLGELVTKFAILYRGGEAVVVDGYVRDAAALKREQFPVWANGVNPVGCYNTPPDTGFPKEREATLRSQYDGGIAVCDDGGVVVIGRDDIGADMLERLNRIEVQEDIWRFCLNTLKWDTKKIVCDKAYLHDTENLPSVYMEKLEQLAKPLDKSE